MFSLYAGFFPPIHSVCLLILIVLLQVIKSLIIWLRMMGKENVVKLRVMVMGMLRVALQSEPSVIKVVLQGWNCFIRKLVRLTYCFAFTCLIYFLCSLSMESLGPLLSQLIVTLSPFIDIWTEIVADIFHYLIVENRSVWTTLFALPSPFHSNFHFHSNFNCCTGMHCLTTLLRSTACLNTLL